MTKLELLVDELKAHLAKREDYEGLIMLRDIREEASRGESKCQWLEGVASWWSPVGECNSGMVGSYAPPKRCPKCGREVQAISRKA